MSTSEVIGSCFSKLSLQWFERISNEFYRHPFFKKELGVVSETIDVGEEEIPWPITFEHYCWDNSINDVWFSFQDIYGAFDPDSNEDYFLFRPTAKQLTQPILDSLQNSISKFNTVQEKNVYIKSAITDLYNGKQRCQIVDKTEYNQVLDYITLKIIEEINMKYAEIFTLSGEIASYPDKIKLEINQNELAILILLLSRSGIIDISKQPEQFAIDIISNHFLYKTEGTEEYSIPKNLRKQVSLFKPSHSPWDAPFDSLKKKLEAGFTEFKS